METVKVNAQTRTSGGKEASRRMRREGLIPAVAYGKQEAAMSLSVSPKDLTTVLLSERGRNSVVELAVDGATSFKALICDYQVHPVTRDLLHADFLRITEDDEVLVEVPFDLTGRAKGVVMGGILRQVFRRLPLRCAAKNVPVKLTHDITELEIDQQVQVKDLALPEGVSVRLPDAQTVVLIAEDKRKARAEAAAKETEKADPKKKK